MSKYQELKDAALAYASKYRETGRLEDRDALDKAEEKLHAYERGAAELIEAANKRIAELEKAQSDSFRYALELAVSLHKKHFCECVDWEPWDTLIGLLTQIDNMTTGWMNKDSETSNEGRKS